MEKESIQNNIHSKANLIWSIAEILTGHYKPHEYGDIIIPFTVLCRFDSVLEPTKRKVLEAYPELKDSPIMEEELYDITGHRFYNLSRNTFKSLLDDPDNIYQNMKNYINGFSNNILEILRKLKVDTYIDMLYQKKILYSIIQEFTKKNSNFSPKYTSNIEMGYIFEEIIRRFSESHNEDAGQHYTPREVIQLMVELLSSLELKSTNYYTIYDPACGTGGMLTVAKENLLKRFPTKEIICYGQELNDQTFAICKADMLIKGENEENIQNGNTLTEDYFIKDHFDYIISNPPFGREWKNEKKIVESELKDENNRYLYGLPPVTDSQTLFLQIALSKMKENGSRVAIIQNGSPLFSGDAGSGLSNIRCNILEKDLLEAIISLPKNIFYNTGIETYIWILSNKKEEKRKGKVQLINASTFFEKQTKPLGQKKNYLSKENIEQIKKIYIDFQENEYSKILSTIEFGYHQITIEYPKKDDYGINILKNGKKIPDSTLRDTERVPLKIDIQDYFKKEVAPYTKDTWIDFSKTK